LAVRKLRIRQGAARVHCIPPPTSVTIAKRPFVRGGMANSIFPNLGRVKRNLRNSENLDGRALIRDRAGLHWISSPPCQRVHLLSGRQDGWTNPLTGYCLARRNIEYFFGGDW
jgi:hypothetical protein